MGCSLRATDTNGNSYLHAAALHGAIRVAQLLLNTFECDPNCENAQGATPLHLACAKGEERIVDLLLSNYKCQTSSKDKMDRPLYIMLCFIQNWISLRS